MDMTMPKAYEREERAIRKEYRTKSVKSMKKLGIGLFAGAILTVASIFVGTNKAQTLRENYPIHKIYRDNQNSLIYLNDKLSQYNSEKFPEFLSENIKNKLERISIPEDSAKISSLEDLIKITEQKNNEIINTSEYKEYSEKIERNARILFLPGLYVISLILSVLGINFMNVSNSRRKDKEIDTLKEKYKITRSSQ